MGESGQELPLRTLAYGARSEISRSTNVVVRTQTEWNEFWRWHQGALFDPSAKIPTVDFEKEMVLAVTMGLRPTGGYAIKIKSVESTSTSLKIIVAQEVPTPDAIVTTAFTAPFHFVAVPKSELKPDIIADQSKATK